MMLADTSVASAGTLKLAPTVLCDGMKLWRLILLNVEMDLVRLRVRVV
jgi:hypothetical protein